LTSRRAEEEEREFDPGREGGFGSFLRSLLAGVPWSERAEREDVLHLPRPARGILRLHNANGRTRVSGEERDDIEVVALKSARAESEEAAKDLLDEIELMHQTSDEGLALEVEVPRRWNRRGVVSLDVRVPRDLPIEVIASNGKIAFEHLQASARARSSNGSVYISDVVGDIEVATSNAKVCCCGTRGRLVARSSNGKIELENHSGSIDASTSNGLIRACMAELGSEGVQLATSNGRIVLELPEEVDAELDIRVDNGVIRNDRELDESSRVRSGQLRGRLGHGGATIKLRTSNGSVSVR
jgi:hypothetical protein